ncbi:MAG: nucleotide exchange factor GrpE [Firmicutes bacterium]|nr:nucleotide exchange factor GrpE [Bacillota bacterium]
MDDVPGSVETGTLETAGNGATSEELCAKAHSESSEPVGVVETDPALLLESLARAEATAQEASEQLLRTRADFENFRRRSRQEAERVAEAATERMAGALLPVVDNLERALEAGRSHGCDPGVLEGIRMVMAQLLGALEREEVRPISVSPGVAFDPRIHEAVATVEAGEHADNTVVEEFQRGYFFKSRILRPSMVKVARKKVTEGEGQEPGERQTTPL